MIDFLGIFTRLMLAAPAPQPAQPAPPAQPLRVAPLVLAQNVAATSLSANQVVDRVQKFYADVQHVTAKFRQSVTNVTFGSTKTSDGNVWIMKPGKMRWDYYEKKKNKAEREKSFISNGTDLYVVEYDNKQIITKNLQQDLMPVAVTFLYGKGDLKTEFNAELDRSGAYGGKGDLVLKLTPKKPSAQYKNLYLVVAPDNFRVKQSVIIDSSNNKNHFTFYEPNFKKAVDPDWFEFDPNSPAVKHYRIVNANQKQTRGKSSGSASKKP